jgi:thioredoxin-related protein
MPPVGEKSDSDSAIKSKVEQLINDNKIVIFSKTTCPWCVKVKELISSKITKDYFTFVLDEHGKWFTIQLLILFDYY